MRFIDTDVLFHAVVARDARRHQAAVEIVRHALVAGRDAMTSTGVMQELVLLLDGEPGATAEVIDSWLSRFYPLLRGELTMDVVRAALQLELTCALDYRSAVTVAAAEKLGCAEIVSGRIDQKLVRKLSIAIVDPFTPE